MLEIGVCVHSTLDESDPLAGRARYEDYRLHVAGGAAVQIEMDALAVVETIPGGQEEVVQTRAYSFDTYLELRPPTGGDPLMVNDDRPGSLNSRLVFVAPDTGDFVVRARAFGVGVGDYVLRVTATAPPRPAEQIGGESFSGTLNSESPVLGAADDSVRAERFTFGGHAGERVRFMMNQGSSELWLRLLDSGGNNIASGFGFSNELVELVAVLPREDSYVLQVASGSAQLPMGFNVSMQRAMPPPPPVPSVVRLNEPQSGTLTIASAAGGLQPDSDRIDYFYDLYVVRADPRQALTITVDTEPNQFDPVVEIGSRTAAGFNVVGIDDDSGAGLNSWLVVPPRFEPAFLIRVRSYRLDVGSYRLTVRTGALPPPTVP